MNSEGRFYLYANFNKNLGMLDGLMKIFNNSKII